MILGVSTYSISPFSFWILLCFKLVNAATYMMECSISPCICYTSHYACILLHTAARNFYDHAHVDLLIMSYLIVFKMGI